MSGQITVYVWRSGLIQFGETTPEGAIAIATGPKDILRPIVEVNAVQCWDNESFRVGNVATAESDVEALSELELWGDRINTQLQKRLQELQEASHA